MASIATEGDVIELARYLSDQIPKLAEQAKSTGGWTVAVYDAFNGYKNARPGWRIYPETKAKEGEYLCDFMLFQERYGPRIACECQWQHSARWGPHSVKLAWSFDKLLGVKADIKVFVFEGETQEWESIRREYLTGYALLSPDEAFLLLKFDESKRGFHASWWKPSKCGIHREDEINFDPIVLETAL
jgi:hypothetical protein